MRTACSLASAPPLVKKTFSKPSGAMPAISSAAWARCSLAKAGAIVQSLSACSLIAAITRGCWWPMLVKTSWEEKSR